MRITVQYFDGCPHWKIAELRVGFRSSPTILLDGRDPFASGDESIGLGCRVFRTEDGVQGSPTEAQLRDVITRNI